MTDHPTRAMLRTGLMTIALTLAMLGAEASASSNLSAEGRKIAFTSAASNLVAGDRNGAIDVFVRNLKTGVTRRVSVSSAGGEGNGDSFDPSFSANGRRVAFSSSASNLVAGDSNSSTDVFVHSLETGKTRRVSRRSNGRQGGGTSAAPSISATGRFVAFQSAAPNLVGGDTNGVLDVFVHDLRTRATRRVSVRSNGRQGGARSSSASISANGRRVAFESRAPLTRRARNGKDDVFLRNLNTNRTRLVSAGAGGGSPSISANGRRVAFHSGGRGLAPGPHRSGDVFVRSLRTGNARRVVPAGRRKVVWTSDPSMSANGRRVAFESLVRDLPGDTYRGENVFVHNLKTARMRWVSVGQGGVAGDCESRLPSISPNGRRVGFQSYSSNLVPGDENDDWDVFVRSLRTGTTERMSVALDGGDSDGPSGLDWVFDRGCL